MSRVLKNKECALICRTSTTDSSRMLRRYSSPTGPSGLASRKAFNACDLPPKILVHFLCEYSRRNGYIWKTGISIIYSTISCNLPQPGQQTGQSGSTPNPQFSEPIKKRPWHQAKGVFWKWRRRESNSRPLACHASALPIELRPQYVAEPRRIRAINRRSPNPVVNTQANHHVIGITFFHG